VRARRLDVHVLLRSLSLRGSWIEVVADDRSLLPAALSLDAEQRFCSAVYVRDLDADPFAFAIGSGATDFAAVLADEDLDVLR
jgi:hypothetical protein